MKLHHFPFLVFAKAWRSVCGLRRRLDSLIWAHIQLPAHSASALLEARLS
jgi:hypothetical protein